MPTLESRPAETVDAQRDQFESQVDRVAEQYDARAEGKAGIQKAMDWGRQFVNGGYGDDQFKNIGQTQQAIDKLRAGVQSGDLAPGDAARQLQALQQRFEGESGRVEKAQEHNATLGGVVHDTTRAAVVGLGGVLGAGSSAVVGGLATLGVGAVPAGIVGGVAGATAAANAFDAVSEGLQQADKKLGNGGSAGFAPELDTKRSAAGLLANAASGEKISGKDVLNTATNTVLDGVGGGWTGSTIQGTKTAIAATHVTAQATARQAGLGAAEVAGVQAGKATVAGAAAKVSVANGIGQSASTVGIQTLGTAIDPSLSAQQKQQQIAANAKESVAQLPGTLLFGAAGNAAGVVVKPANALLDASAQMAIDTTANVGQASLGNALAGRDARLTEAQWIETAVMGVPGAAQNIVQAMPAASVPPHAPGAAVEPRNAIVPSDLGQTAAPVTVQQLTNPDGKSAQQLMNERGLTNTFDEQHRNAMQAHGLRMSIEPPDDIERAPVSRDPLGERFADAEDLSHMSKREAIEFARKQPSEQSFRWADPATETELLMKGERTSSTRQEPSANTGRPTELPADDGIGPAPIDEHSSPALQTPPQNNGPAAWPLARPAPDTSLQKLIDGQASPAAGFPWPQFAASQAPANPSTAWHFGSDSDAITLLPQKPPVRGQFDDVELAGFDNDAALAAAFPGFTSGTPPLQKAWQGTSQVLGQLLGGAGHITQSATAWGGVGLKNIEEAAPVQWLGNSAPVQLAGSGLNLLANAYRSAGRLVQNNPVMTSTAHHVQAIQRQAKYFPAYASAQFELNKQKGTATQAVNFYDTATRDVGAAGMEARAVAAETQRQFERASAAQDPATERDARAQAKAGAQRLGRLAGDAMTPMKKLADKIERQIDKGQTQLRNQELLYSQRAQHHDNLRKADHGVQTPRVLEARAALREAALPFTLPKAVAEKTERYETLRAQIDDSDDSDDHRRAVKKAHADLANTTDELARLTLAGNDPALDVIIGRADGLYQQIERLQGERSAIAYALDQLAVVKAGAASGSAVDAQDALATIEQSHTMLAERLASAQDKRAILDDEPVFVGEADRMRDLLVDARAADSDLGGKVADIGFLHSTAKDLFDGRGKGRIDALSNKKKIADAQQGVDAARNEIGQWQERLGEIDGSLLNVLGTPGMDSASQQQALAALHWQRGDAAAKLGQAEGRLPALERMLDLEQRAAEPRSIQVKVKDLRAKINTSAAVLRSVRKQHAKLDSKLQQQKNGLEERLAQPQTAAQRETLQTNIDMLETRIVDNAYANDRAQQLHANTEALLAPALQALDEAQRSAGLTPGKVGRNALRATSAFAAFARLVTVAQLQTGQIGPDKAQDLTNLLKQMNVPGSELPITAKEIEPVPVPGMPGVHVIHSAQGDVYAWRAQGTINDQLFMAQVGPQARGLIAAAPFNGGNAGTLSPNITKGTDGYYLVVDSEKFSLASLTVSSVTHPPGSTAVNWWETVRVEFTSIGGVGRINTKSTNPRTGNKEPMIEGVQTNSTKLPKRVKLPGKLPLLGDVLQLPPTMGFSVTVKNSLGLGTLSLVYDPDMGVGQTSDRTVSSEVKKNLTKDGPIVKTYPGTQPYGFFGTAVRIEKNYYALVDPRNDDSWLMDKTKGVQSAFEFVTLKTAAETLKVSDKLQGGLDNHIKPSLQQGRDKLDQLGDEAGDRLRQVPPTIEQWLDDITQPPPPEPKPQPE